MPADRPDDADRPLSFFDRDDAGGAASSSGPFVADEGHFGVVPMALVGLALVAALTAALALVFGRPVVAIVALGAAALLGWAASATWVAPLTVTVERGIVRARRGEERHAFDLRSERTKVEVHGRPGDPDWQVRFLRRGLDPVVVDARAVDPHAFLARLREWRPDL